MIFRAWDISQTKILRLAKAAAIIGPIFSISVKWKSSIRAGSPSEPERVETGTPPACERAHEMDFSSEIPVKPLSLSEWLPANGRQ